MTIGIATDASCSQNPGPVSFRGVDMATGEVVFDLHIEAMATNNLGEFFGICKALVYLHKRGDKSTPVYSDSRTAIAWVTKRRVKSYSPGVDKEVRMLAYEWEDWLRKVNPPNPVIKWRTDLYGEIVADYGKKRKKKGN